MAKYDEREGNSCHVHLSLSRRRPATRCWLGDGDHGAVGR